MMKRNKQIHFYINLNKEEEELLEKMSDLLNLKKTDILRLLIRNFFKKNKEFIKNLNKLDDKEATEQLLKLIFLNE